MQHNSIKQFRITKENISDICRRAHRATDDVNLIAVSKNFDAEAIKPFLDEGQRVFGENRVQEAYGKWPILKENYVDIELHLLGPLQTNKVRQALRLFDVIHTLDSLKLAERIARISKEEHTQPRLFIQVNTGNEKQKAGLPLGEAVAFAKYCIENFFLHIVGFMCIPPVNQDSRLHFALLQKLSQEAGLSMLSMGMSADYEDAIFMGATHIRLGRVIFGDRM